jgi:hypothetical protein
VKHKETHETPSKTKFEKHGKTWTHSEKLWKQ